MVVPQKLPRTIQASGGREPAGPILLEQNRPAHAGRSPAECLPKPCWKSCGNAISFNAQPEAPAANQKCRCLRLGVKQAWLRPTEDSLDRRLDIYPDRVYAKRHDFDHLPIDLAGFGTRGRPL